MKLMTREKFEEWKVTSQKLREESKKRSYNPDDYLFCECFDGEWCDVCNGVDVRCQKCLKYVEDPTERICDKCIDPDRPIFGECSPRKFLQFLNYIRSEKKVVMKGYGIFPIGYTENGFCIEQKESKVILEYNNDVHGVILDNSRETYRILSTFEDNQFITSFDISKGNPIFKIHWTLFENHVHQGAGILLRVCDLDLSGVEPLFDPSDLQKECCFENFMDKMGEYSIIL